MGFGLATNAAFSDFMYSSKAPSRRQIGALEVNALGFDVGDFKEQKSAISLISRANELGVELFCAKTAKSAALLGEAFKKKRDKAIIAIKSEIQYNKKISIKNQLKAAVERSLQQLGLDYIDLYILPKIPFKIEPALLGEGVQELIAEGKIREFALSEVERVDLWESAFVCPISAVEAQYSMTFREIENDGILYSCEQINCAFIASAPLNAGLLEAVLNKSQKSKNGKNADKLLNLLAQIAAQKRLRENTENFAKIALCWALHQSKLIIPIVKITSEKELSNSLDSLEISFSKSEIEEINNQLEHIRFN